MKRAKLTVQSVAVNCPYCDEELPQPDSGSLNWDVSFMQAGQEVFCFACTKTSLLPKVGK